MGIAKIFSGGTLFQKYAKNFVKIFKKFSKKLQEIVKKIVKMDFWAYYSKTLTNPAFNFCAFGRQTLFAGNFWENFQKITKKS